MCSIEFVGPLVRKWDIIELSHTRFFVGPNGSIKLDCVRLDSIMLNSSPNFNVRFTNTDVIYLLGGCEIFKRVLQLQKLIPINSTFLKVVVIDSAERRHSI